MSPRTRTWQLASIAIALLARPVVAYACGGDGDSDGSSSGSSGDSYDGGGYFAGGNTVTTACYETSDIHGYRQCSSYGSGWAIPEHLPTLAFELSSWSTTTDFTAVDVSGTMSHTTGAAYTYRVVGADLGDEAQADGARLRLVGHRGHLYLGLEGGLAKVDTPDRMTTTTTADGVTTLTTSADKLLMAGMVVGADHRIGHFSVGAELFAGGSGLVVEATSNRGACESSDTHWAGRGVIEARARADVWLTPWLTLGAYAGRDVTSGRASGGLGIAGHLRAFDGSH